MNNNNMNDNNMNLFEFNDQTKPIKISPIATEKWVLSIPDGNTQINDKIIEIENINNNIYFGVINRETRKYDLYIKFSNKEILKDYEQSIKNYEERDNFHITLLRRNSDTISELENENKQKEAFHKEMLYELSNSIDELETKNHNQTIIIRNLLDSREELLKQNKEQEKELKKRNDIIYQERNYKNYLEKKIKNMEEEYNKLKQEIEEMKKPKRIFN